MRENPNSPPPHWPNFTSLSITCIPITSLGQWLFERDPDEEIDEIDWGKDPYLYMEEDELPAPEDRRHNLFRHVASSGLINELYIAAGKATTSMPALRHMWLGASTATRIYHNFQSEANATSACATWESTPPYELNGDVLDVWKGVSKKNLGLDLDVRYVELPIDGFWKIRQ
jgi:hypothetical protein